MMIPSGSVGWGAALRAAMANSSKEKPPERFEGYPRV